MRWITSILPYLMKHLFARKSASLGAQEHDCVANQLQKPEVLCMHVVVWPFSDFFSLSLMA
jgi:hypothetical protein